MESFFRKLQEVTELPGSPSAENDGEGDGNEESVEELRERLANAQRQAEEWKAKWSALQAETSTLSDEYAAYKTKVSTWRDQMRAARSQDRRTIELLRQSTSSQSTSAVEGCPSPSVTTSSGSSSVSSAAVNVSSGGSNSTVGRTAATAATTSVATVVGHTTPVANVEAVYVQSLEEQIRSQKEALRLMGDERDNLRLELRRATEQRREALARLAAGYADDKSADDARAGRAGVAAVTSGLSSTSTSSTNALVDHSQEASTNTAASRVDSGAPAEIRRLQLLLDSRTLEMEALQRANQALDTQVEQLHEENHRAAEAANNAVRELQEQLRHAEELLDSNRQAQYIRSLESEVRMWKAETQIARAGLAPAPMSLVDDTAASTPPAAASVEASNNDVLSSSSQAANHNCVALQEARAQLEAKDALVADLRKQLAQLAIESSMRDEALDQMFVDCRALEANFRLSAEECNAVRGSKCALERKLHEIEMNVKDLTFQRDEALDRLSRVSQQHTVLSKEHARINDVLRAVKQDLARRCGDLEASTISSSSSSRRPTGPLVAGVSGAATTEGGAGAGAQRDGLPTDAINTPSTDGGVAGSNSATPSPDTAYVSAANLDRLLERYQLHQLASARQQVFQFWNHLSQQRRFSVSHARWRSFVAVALFLLLALLFTSYQAMSVMEDEAPHHKAMEDALAACRLQLTRGAQTLPSKS